MYTSLKKTFIERSTIAIYLLRSDNPPLQAKIRIDAGFTANWDDPVNRIRQCRICTKILDYNKFSMRKEGNLRWECNECRKIANMINIWRKKIKVAKFVTMKVKECISVKAFLDALDQDGNLNIQIQCFDCNAGLNHLPAL